MFSATKTVFKAFTQQSFPPKDDLPSNFYTSINWKNSVVAGSYALKQFTGDTSWESHDVDVMIACNNMEEFKQEAEKFETLSDAKLVRQAVFADKNDVSHNSNDELFHDLVLGSRTYTLPKFDRSIQLICLNSEPQNPKNSDVSFFSRMMTRNVQTQQRSVQEILSETCDIPSCVSYSISQKGEKIFHIPEKGREILLTRRGQINDICPNRLKKYQQRGYEFY